MHNPKPAAGVSVAVFRDRDVLLVRRGKAPYEGCWSLPGGSIQWGESAEHAAVRELTEETGLLASSLTLSHVSDVILHGDGGTIVAHFIIIVFAASEVTGTATAGRDAAEVQWCSRESRLHLKTTPDLETAIQQAERALCKDRL